MATHADLITEVRAATDRDGADVQIPDTVLSLWLNTAYSQLVLRLTALVPDRWTKFTANFAGAASTDLSSSLATDFSRIRAVQVLDSDYLDIGLAPDASPETACDLSYRQRGAATLDLFPATAWVGRTFRVKYLYRPTALSGSVAVDLPEGGETVLVEEVAARCRQRWDEDPTAHLAARAAAWTTMRDSLQPFYSATQTGQPGAMGAPGTLWPPWGG